MSELLIQGKPAEMVRGEPGYMPVILQMASMPNVDADKLMKLMELQERWEANEARKAFNDAMARFKENPPKISKNKHVKVTFKDGGGSMEYDHATLDEVTDSIIPALAAVGVRHRWEPEQKDGRVFITCVLSHNLGHSERTTLSGQIDNSGKKNPIQAEMSTVTYLQRYTLLAATGLAAGLDDDGNGAGGGSMELGEFDRYFTMIETVKNLTNLQTIFKQAYVAADKAKDEKAKNQFIAAKDKRKEELNEGN